MCPPERSKFKLLILEELRIACKKPTESCRSTFEPGVFKRTLSPAYSRVLFSGINPNA